MQDDNLLLEFMCGFYGYGSYSGRYWFIGMEEAGVRSIDDVRRRLYVWKDRGRSELEDLVEYHAGIGLTECFGADAKLQRTWARLIRVKLAMHGLPFSNEDVRSYQITQLGRRAGHNCLIELLPLPSSSTREWIYSECSGLHFLRTRREYKGALLSKRIEHLRQKIRTYKPIAVVFYGISYREYWKEIAGLDFQPFGLGASLHAHRGSTGFVILKHPATRGLRNKYFEEAGRNLADQIAGEQPL